MSSKMRLEGGWDFILGVLEIFQGCERERDLVNSRCRKTLWGHEVGQGGVGGGRDWSGGTDLVRRTQEARLEAGIGCGERMCPELKPWGKWMMLGSSRLWWHLRVCPSAWRNSRPLGDGEPKRKSRLAWGTRMVKTLRAGGMSLCLKGSRKGQEGPSSNQFTLSPP